LDGVPLKVKFGRSFELAYYKLAAVTEFALGWGMERRGSGVRGCFRDRRSLWGVCWEVNHSCFASFSGGSVSLKTSFFKLL